MINYDVTAIDRSDLYGCAQTCSEYASWVNALNPDTDVVAANLNYELLADDAQLSTTRITPWSVKTLSGRKVGIVGMLDINARVVERRDRFLALAQSKGWVLDRALFKLREWRVDA